MKERPIIFSGPMVRTILEGRKTQTRRVIKPEWSRCLDLEDEDDRVTALLHSPYGVPGDRLWVRESHWRFSGCSYRGEPWQGFTPSPDGDPFKARCYDDSQVLESAQQAAAVVRVPSIHMPRWASRITLEITEVRVQRLQDISDEDAKAEGFGPRSAKELFRGTWSVINAKRGFGWDTNPWVWAITFQILNSSAAVSVSRPSDQTSDRTEDSPCGHPATASALTAG